MIVGGDTTPPGTYEVKGVGFSADIPRRQSD
jgi:hypothetical protein